MGDTVATAQGNEVTIYRWRGPIDRPVDPAPGRIFSEIELKFCVAPGWEGAGMPFYLPESFSLEMPNHRRITPENSTYRGDELAVLQLAEGECARGFVVFQTPKGAKPAFVVFISSSIIKWRVP